MRIIVKLVAVLCPIALIAGCGGSSHQAADSSSTGTAVSSTTTPATPAKPTIAASRLVLDVTELPAGWTVTSSNSGSSSGGFCKAPAQAKAGKLTSASAGFLNGGGLPMLFDDVVVIDSAQQAGQDFSIAANALDNCTSFSTDSGGTADLGAMSFPHYGDQSRAYALTTTVDQFNVSVGMVVVRQANVLSIIGLGDLGSVDTSQLEQFTTLAADKVARVNK